MHGHRRRRDHGGHPDAPVQTRPPGRRRPRPPRPPRHAAARHAPPPSAARQGSAPASSGSPRTATRSSAGQKVGVVTNPTGITRDARHIVDVMHADDRVNLTAVFGPEHGFRGTAQAGGSEGRYDDPATGLPVYDTYLKSGQPLADIFTASGVDTVVFDIQDVGARFYTYIWTLYDCMEAAAARRQAVRRAGPAEPGDRARAPKGPCCDKEFATFVGRQPISQAHGMTVAELARLFNGEFLTDAGGAGDRTDVGVEAVASSSTTPGCPGCRRARTCRRRTPRSCTPGRVSSRGRTCRRGAARPGRSSCSAPRGSTGGGRRRRTRLGLPGVRFREAYFAPTFSKFQGKTIGGVQIHVHDRAAYDPVRTGIGLLVTAKKVWSGFAWRPDNWIDKLTGSTRVRTMIDAGAGRGRGRGGLAGGAGGVPGGARGVPAVPVAASRARAVVTYGQPSPLAGRMRLTSRPPRGPRGLVMADPEMSVTPYWELTFDADGDVDGRQRDRLLDGVEAARGRGSASSSRTAGTATGPSRPGSTAASSPRSRRSRRDGEARVRGRACGPRCGSRTSRSRTSSRARRRSPAAGRPALDKDTRHALLEVFPGRATVVEQIARLLEQRPDDGRRVGGVRAARTAAGRRWSRRGRRARSRRTPSRRTCREGDARDALRGPR